ncbi:hypothetical protein ACQ4PT_071862 [Festuca glaucescens]
MPSYAVVNGGATIYVSSGVEVVGTYAFDTAEWEWRHAGKWLLPFAGRAELVHELGLWFGLSASRPNGSLCALDLSTATADMDDSERSSSALRHNWDVDLGLPEGCNGWPATVRGAPGEPRRWQVLRGQYTPCCRAWIRRSLATKMEQGTAAAGRLEVVVFPWLAFGHMIPFLELSKRLAAKGHAVAFVSTPRNLARLPPVPASLSTLLRFVPLPLPAVEGLPEGAESTADLPPDKVELLKKAMDGLSGPLAAFLADAVAVGRSPDWIVLDFCHHWVPHIADHHKADWYAGAFRANASGFSDMERVWHIFERCRLTIYRSCHELEPRMFALHAELYRKPAIPAGILLPGDRDEEHRQSSPGVARPQVLRWLDSQPPKSVIYVALGSEAPLTLQNIHEIALGLELAGVCFLWALRKPADTENDDELLPSGFEERTQARGAVCTGWVPQMEALAHGATVAFLTHCGWGSTIESFAFGLPLVMLPFIIDTPMIARAMAARGIGVEVARDESDGSFNRDGIAAAVRSVMVEEQGKAFATNARKLKELVADKGSQEQYIDELVDHLRRYKDE